MPGSPAWIPSTGALFQLRSTFPSVSSLAVCLAVCQTSKTPNPRMPCVSDDLHTDRLSRRVKTLARSKSSIVSTRASSGERFFAGNARRSTLDAALCPPRGSVNLRLYIDFVCNINMRKIHDAFSGNTPFRIRIRIRNTLLIPKGKFGCFSCSYTQYSSQKYQLKTSRLKVDINFT